MAGGLGGLIVTLGLNATEFFSGLTKAEQQTKNLVEATKKQSAAIDRQIKSLQHQATTIGMTTRELKLYELAQKGATAGQLAQAGAALRTVENFNLVQKGVRALGTALGALGVGSIAGIVALFQSVVKGIDDMNDLKDATGASIENISALEDVALRTGGSFDTVATALIKFNKVLNDTDEEGKKVANIIKAIGLDAEELKRIDPAEAMRRLAVAFAQFADDGSKGRAFLALFGKTTRELAPLMTDLAKQTELAAKVTTQAAEEAEKFRHRTAALGKDVLDLARALAGPLVSAMNDVAAATKKAKAEGAGWIEQFFVIQKQLRASLFGAGGEDAMTSPERLKRIEELNKLIAAGNAPLQMRSLWLKQIAELEAKAPKLDSKGGAGRGFINPELPKPSLGTITDEEKKLISEAQRYLETLQKQGEKTHELTFLERALLDIQKKRLTGITPQLEAQIIAAAKLADQSKRQFDASQKAAKGTMSEGQRYLETLQKQGEKTQELTVLEQTLLDIQTGRIGGLTPKLKEQIIVAAKEVDARKATVDMLKEEQKMREEVASIVHANVAAAMAETAQLIAGNEALQNEIDLIGADAVARAALENAKTSSLVTTKELALESLREAGIINETTRALESQIAALKEKQRLTTTKADVENFAGVQKNAEESFEKFKKETEQMSEFAKRASENIQDALGDTLLRSLKGDFKSIAQLWSDLILKMIAQAAAARLNEHLFGKTGLGGVLGPALNALLGGGDTGAGSVTGGGFNDAGGNFVPGGNNPSAFEAPQSAESRAMAQSIGKVQAPAPSLVQNINIGDYATRNDLMNAMTVAKEQAKAEILQLQRGGHLQNA